MTHKTLQWATAGAALLALSGCADDEASAPSIFARSVVSFEAGDGAGHGADEFPEVILGAPGGLGTNQGAIDGVLSLGSGGEIILDLGDPVEAGPGPDLIVFENPFWVNGDPKHVFAEPAEVAVSLDATTWSTFPCAPVMNDVETFEGCAGWRPVLAFDAEGSGVLDPERTGGDPFDVDELGVEAFRYVRITDLSEGGAPPSAGFDLDAVGVIRRD